MAEMGIRERDRLRLMRDKEWVSGRGVEQEEEEGGRDGGDGGGGGGGGEGGGRAARGVVPIDV